MKNIVLALALCASCSLEAFHLTRKVCAAIPKAIPTALNAILKAFEHEDQARKAALEAESIIIKSSDPEVVRKLRVDLLPNLIVAAAQTRSVLHECRYAASVSSESYDERAKSEEYIAEFAPEAFGEKKSINFYVYDKGYLAYEDFLRHVSKNPELLKITKLQ